MAYQNNSSKTTMSVILSSNGAKALAQNLNLTQDQLMKANSSALALSSNSVLRNCDNFSILKYCYETARFNFSRDDCIYPVPYGNSIQAQLSYKGVREIALRSNKYKDINCSIVYSCDEIYRDEDTGKVKVKFNKDYNAINGASVVGFYAFAIDKDGLVCNSLYWSKEQCEKHGKTYSKTYNNLWGKDDLSFNKMAKKTLIKQLCAELSTTPELNEALKQDQYVYGGEHSKGGYMDNPLNQDKDTTRNDVDVDIDLTKTDDETGEIKETESVEDVENPF